MGYFERYLGDLPSGIGSFPACKAKGGLVKAALEILPVQGREARLPPDARRLVSTPPLHSAWIPETEYVGTCLALADAHELDTEGFRKFWYSSMQRMTGGIYSAVLGLLRPETLLRTTASRWSHFHLGTSLSSDRVDDSLELFLEYPSALFPRIIVEGYASVFQVLVDRSRKPGGKVRLAGIADSTGAHSRARFVAQGWMG